MQPGVPRVLDAEGQQRLASPVDFAAAVTMARRSQNSDYLCLVL
jgi:hypothetical protein